MATDLHVLELGEGEPIVLVHGGFGSSRAAFVAQRELADEFRLLVVDRKVNDRLRVFLRGVTTDG